MTQRLLLLVLSAGALALLFFFSVRVGPAEASTPPSFINSTGEEVAGEEETALAAVSRAPVLHEEERQAGLRPSAEPITGLDFDLGELAVPNVLIIDENTDRPLAGAICEVTDVNGVTLVAETDSRGALLTDEMLLTGEVALSVFQGASKSKWRALDGEGLPRRFESARSRSGAALGLAMYGFTHSGDSSEPDRWRMAEKRWIPLEVVGDPGILAKVELAMPSLDFFGSTRKRRAQDPKRLDIDEGVMRVSDDAFPLVFEAYHLRTVGARQPQFDLPHWSRQGVGEPAPGRVLRAVQFLPQGVLCATADANIVPHLHEFPLRLEFVPLVERDAGLIREQYGEGLGSRIIAHLGIDDPSQKEEARIVGTITSDSGTFHGTVEVFAEPLELTRSSGYLGDTARGLVRWKEEPPGVWTGSFELSNLDVVRHRVALSTGYLHAVEPKEADTLPTLVFDAGSFIVRDFDEYVPVVLRIRQPQGAPRNSCFALFTPRYRRLNQPQSGFFSALPDATRPGGDGSDEGYTLSRAFPRGRAFTVTVQSNGYEQLDLSEEDFEWDGERLVCERLLRVEGD